MNEINIVVIGGGASGLFYAMTAADLLKKEKKDVRITILEKESKAGRKLLATGNGKCNLSNQNMRREFFSGSFTQNIDAVLSKYNADSIVGIFGRHGLYCTPDNDGRLYPYSRQAAAVVDTIMLELNRESSVCIKYGETVHAIRKSGAGYTVCTQHSEFFADYVIMAAGGCASPRLGSNGSGLDILGKMGIDISKPFPSLCPVIVSDKCVKRLKGIRCRCSVALIADYVEIKRESGELQITENALSGICIFQLSRYVNEYFTFGTVDGNRTDSIYIDVDLFPDMSRDDLYKLLIKRRNRHPNINIEEFFTGLINKKIGMAVYEGSGIGLPASAAAECLDDNSIAALADTFKGWMFNPCAASDWDAAQVTAGGVFNYELEKNTLELKKYSGVYCIGEIVDTDGVCGGYNLHWAWISAITAANATVRAIKNRSKGDAHND